MYLAGGVAATGGVRPLAAEAAALRRPFLAGELPGPREARLRLAEGCMSLITK